MSAEIDTRIDRIIDRYLEHPEDPEAWEAARTPEVFAVFIRRCLAAVDSDPSQGLPMLDHAYQVTTCSCEVVQILGLRSHALTLLGSITEASQILTLAFQIGAMCQACRATLRWYRTATHAALKDLRSALSDANECIRLYQELNSAGLSDHSLDGNGLANAFLKRAEAQYFIGSEMRDAPLLSGAVADVETALGVIVPNETPKLYGLALFNLAVALYATGNPEDLARSYGYLSQARRRMGLTANGKPSQERGKLAWVTAMVEHELIAHRRVLPRETVLDMNRRGVRPFRVLRKLSDATSDFVKVGMPQESAACASDHARVIFPDYGAVRELVSDVFARLESRFEFPDVAPRIGELEPIRRAVDRVVEACNPKRWDVYYRVREAIEGLRNAAGPGMITCLIRWKDG